MTNSTALATISSLRTNLQNFRHSTPRSAPGATGYLRFGKGDWTFGRDNAPLDLDGVWVIHPQSLQHGWICWRGGSLHKEVLVPFSQPLPPENSLPEAPEPAPDSDDQPGYQHQMAFQCVGLEGKQTGVQLTFKTATVGGRSAVDKMVDEMFARMDDVEISGEGGIFPVVMFGTDSYKHKTRGKIFVPTITLVGWSTNEPGAEVEWLDDAEPEAKPEPKPEVAAPAGRRRRVAGA